MDYIVFTDESYITDSRYQSISAFSLPVERLDSVTAKLKDILTESNVQEFKWQKLKDAKYYFCAEKILKFVNSEVLSMNLRVDTLVWDTQDSRHNLQGRHDNSNFERMFFHLLSNTMKKREPDKKWSVRPDVRGGIDWQTVHACLSNKGRQIQFENTVFGSFFTDPHFHIHEFTEKESHEEICIQIADLFSGLSVFSRDQYSVYQAWLENKTPSLFDNTETVPLTNRQKFRFQLLEQFDAQCKSAKLGVSLKSKGYLHTFDSKNPINFWHYEPQGEYDKAPVRAERNI